MAYCKRCPCGHVNLYEKMGGAPLRCSKCSRFIAAVTEEIYVEAEQTVREETPQPEVAEQEIPQTEVTQPEPTEQQPQEPEVTDDEEPSAEQMEAVGTKRFRITLESPDGSFVLPVTTSLTVGRNAAGMEYLGPYADVSRQHFTIAPRSNGISATVTDESSWGTYINGVRLIKGSSVAVSNYTEIRLASRAFLLVRVKEVSADA